MEFSHPYSKIAFTVSKYEHSGKLNAIKAGNISVKIKGIRNKPGNLWIFLYDKNPVGYVPIAYKFDVVKVNDEEIIHVINNVKYGEYVLMIQHDENGNEKLDTEWNGVPKEGVYVYNYDPSIGMNLTFDKLKFKFLEKEKNIEIVMSYPPYDFLKK
jgi:uncharacterized protein (DUF2141 family)